MIVYDKGVEEFENFLLSEDSFDEMSLGKTESIMCQGNGYMCIRGYAEEAYPKKVATTLIAGTFNIAMENEVTELPNISDAFSMELLIDGKRFFLAENNVENYSKILNLKTGELTRTFAYKTEENEFRFVMRRFVSAADVHIAVSRVEITAMKKAAQIVVLSGIDNRATNSGECHLIENVRRFYEKKFAYTHLVTNQSKIDIYVNASHKIFVDDAELDLVPAPKMSRRTISAQYNLDVAAGSVVAIEKYISYYTSNDADEVRCDEPCASYKILAQKMAVGYFELLEESVEVLAAKLWERDYIKITSSEAIAQLGINYAMYHMFVMTPSHDNRMNIGAKGLSGEGYKGHTFWDTEVFLLPRFIVQNPAVARKLLEYRYLGLEGARRKAEENGFEGAMFPWEAANPKDGEVTPKYNGVDVYTGDQLKVITGDIEIHIVADVAYGVYLYNNFTADQEFMNSYGYEIIMETAKFWNSRLEYADGKYHINDVIGPDEYTEHVDDNAYTNYLAKWNMEYACRSYNDLLAKDPELLARLDEKISIGAVIETIRERAERIYVPVPDAELIIDQDRTYRSLEEIDLTKYRQAELVASIAKDYGMEQISKLKVSKQADIMVLFLLFGERWADEIKKANFDYYEAFCLHDSSLSLSTYAVLANDIGYERYGYELFKRALLIDIGQEKHSCDEGVHAASYGGVWQCIIYGFAGVRMIGEKLHINPRLPAEMEKIEFNMYYLGQKLCVKASKDTVVVANMGERAVAVIIKNREIEIAANAAVEA
ncbi:glycoside hydrolase family 65 protein [Candidatus Epulonipiscium viviparus]|uniref:glycoside hydrolase family 65 protein n=1 Tax=Candidatus Epulonipiscium viviparus TaxID=420336 RepID=UPI00049848F5|nr:glycosyl hydrolase family 65 protein [Candidatus Epulopiscium viviparus]